MSRLHAAALAALVMVAAGAPAFAYKWQEGREAFDKGDYPLAIFIWTDASVAQDKSNVNDPRYYSWLATAYRLSGDNRKAVETVQRGLRLNPNDGDMQWTLGSAQLALGQPGEALVAAKAAIAAQPQDPACYKLLADVEFALGRYDDAITAAKRVNEIKPMPAAFYTIAACYLQKDDLDSGLDSVRKGLELAPQDPSLLEALGHLSIRAALFDEAAAAFAKAFEAGKSPEAQRWLALSRYLQGRYDEAIAMAVAMVADAEKGRIGISLSTLPAPYFVASVEPGSPAARAGILVGDWLYKVDGEKVAKAGMGSISNAKGLSPVEQVAEMISGPPGTKVSLKLGRRGKFLPYTVDVVREFLRPGAAAQGYALQSLCHRAEGESERATALAEKAVALKTDDSWARTARGFALIDAGKLDDALAVIGTDANQVEVPFRQVAQALCFARKGEVEKAAKIYDENRDMFDPRNVPLSRERAALITALAPLRQGHLDRARALEAEGKYAESLGEYDGALRLASDEQDAVTVRAALFAAAGKLPTPPELPEEARRHVVRGEVLIKDGNLKGALPEFTRAIRLAPYIPKLYYNAALLNGQLKRHGEAIRLMKIYLEAAPGAPDARGARDEIIRWELQLERQGKR